MNRQLMADSSPETLRKEAKRWLKALRAQDPKAHQRLRRSYPGAPPQPGLRDVQYALARGADPRAVSEDGTSTVEQAQRQGLDAVADLLATCAPARQKQDL